MATDSLGHKAGGLEAQRRKTHFIMEAAQLATRQEIEENRPKPFDNNPLYKYTARSTTRKRITLHHMDRENMAFDSYTRSFRSRMSHPPLLRPCPRRTLERQHENPRVLPRASLFAEAALSLSNLLVVECCKSGVGGRRSRLEYSYR